ncbi:MAG TPA: SPOR domain-containing protein, partial [Stellaceae bacterium]|nr:SPOR domain-containing protein [Stellaceae bacterium]
AELLAELRQQFGSLGVAAAAYNAGPARVATWLRGEGVLPAETRLYVRLVTERPVEEWSATGRDARSGRDAEATECVALVATLRRERGSAGEDGPGFAAFAPWGVQLAGNFSKDLAVASFERARRRYAAAIGHLTPMVVGRRLRSRGTRPFYQVRLPAASRVEAAALCARIQATGGACVALRS